MREQETNNLKICNKAEQLHNRQSKGEQRKEERSNKNSTNRRADEREKYPRPKIAYFAGSF